VKGALGVLVLVLAGVAAAAAAPADAVRKPQRRVVTVNDNYYLPVALTVNRGSTIVWRWPDDAGDVHDVKLGKRPKGARSFWSEPGAAGYSFTRKLTVPGRYAIVCTLHEEMTMTITVRR
jgi:plastocyanin